MPLVLLGRSVDDDARRHRHHEDVACSVALEILQPATPVCHGDDAASMRLIA